MMTPERSDLDGFSPNNSISSRMNPVQLSDPIHSWCPSETPQGLKKKVVVP